MTVKRKTVTGTTRETNKRHEEKYGLEKGPNQKDVVRKIGQAT